MEHEAARLSIKSCSADKSAESKGNSSAYIRAARRRALPEFSYSMTVVELPLLVQGVAAKAPAHQ